MALLSLVSSAAQYLFCDAHQLDLEIIRPGRAFALICYTLYMTDSLKRAIARLRELPESLQDSIARAMLKRLDDAPELEERLSLSYES